MENIKKEHYNEHKHDSHENEHNNHEHNHDSHKDEHNHKHKSGKTHSHEHEHSGCAEHGSHLSMFLQFGFSALLFILGLIFIFIKKDSVLFNISTFNFSLSSLCFAIAWLLAGYKVVLTSIKNIPKGIIFDENFLMSVATIGAFILGEWSEGAAVMLFFNLGEIVQHSAVDKSRSSIIDLMDLNPSFARVLFDNNIEKKIAPEEVEIGSLLVVHAGEKIPLDGIIQEGFAELDTSSITGESLPRSAEEGEEVLSGFVNLTGRIIVKTTKRLEDTTAAKMLELIESAQSRKAKVERFITSFAKVYTPIVTLAAVLLSIIPPIISSLISGLPMMTWANFSPWISRGLVFLVISCPCAFVISVPLGYFGGIGGAAKRGILIKGADYIDALSKADAVVFDKTGTLTKGSLKVMALMSVDCCEESKSSFPHTSHSCIEEGKKISKIDIHQSKAKYDILKYAALAELNSNHPIAKAIVESAGINLSPAEFEDLKKLKPTNYKEEAGMGVSLNIEGKNLLVGKNIFIANKLNQDIPLLGDELGGTQVYVAYDNKHLGCIVLTDTLKDDSALAISNLKKLGISHIEMMTGDGLKSAEHTANELGIENFKGQLLPDEKVSNFERIAKAVKAENKNAKVIFVGDGINDAPVLARSDAGIAMGAIGSDAAIEAADVVLMNDSPNLVAKAIELARFTRKIVWENIGLAFIIKIGFLGLGAFGVVGLWSAVFADVGVALLAVFNSLRAKK